MAKDYTQAFCIIGSKGRFHPRYGAYLPAVVPPRSEEEPEPLAPKAGVGYSQLLREMEQLKATINYLEGKINEHIEASKRKRKGLEVIPPLYIKKE